MLTPLHGHAIATHIERTSDEVLQVDHGSLYPALYRLQKRGWKSAACHQERRGTRRGNNWAA